jgi:aspartate kinase
MVSAIGRDLGGISTLGKAITVLTEAGIVPLGVHDLIRKVDLQVIVEEADFEATIKALHKGLVAGEVERYPETLAA